VKRASGWAGRRSALTWKSDYTQLRAGKGILLDARDKIRSSQAAIVSPRLILANVRSRRGTLRAITARFSEDGKRNFKPFYHFHVTGT
jgi:hypothetical protein